VFICKAVISEQEIAEQALTYTQLPLQKQKAISFFLHVFPEMISKTWLALKLDQPAGKELEVNINEARSTVNCQQQVAATMDADVATHEQQNEGEQQLDTNINNIINAEEKLEEEENNNNIINGHPVELTDDEHENRLASPVKTVSATNKRKSNEMQTELEGPSSSSTSENDDNTGKIKKQKRTAKTPKTTTNSELQSITNTLAGNSNIDSSAKGNRSRGSAAQKAAAAGASNIKATQTASSKG
jgi:hypothetical protein